MVGKAFCEKTLLGAAVLLFAAVSLCLAMPAYADQMPGDLSRLDQQGVLCQAGDVGLAKGAPDDCAQDPVIAEGETGPQASDAHMEESFDVAQEKPKEEADDLQKDAGSSKGNSVAVVLLSGDMPDEVQENEGVVEGDAAEQGVLDRFQPDGHAPPCVDAGNAVASKEGVKALAGAGETATIYVPGSKYLDFTQIDNGGRVEWPVWNETYKYINGQFVLCVNILDVAAYNGSVYVSEVQDPAMALKLGLYDKFLKESYGSWTEAKRFGYLQFMTWQEYNADYMPNVVPSTGYEDFYGIYSAAKAYYNANAGKYQASGTVWRSSSSQDVCYVPLLEVKLKGNVHINKVSANPSITDGNPNYSLAGAQYGVYSDSECTKLVTTLTTDANGQTETKDLVDAGTYYVKEIKASAGFMLDPSKYQVTVVAGGTATVNSVEQPTMDPAYISKVDADLQSIGKVQGQASLAGAQYEWRYYAGMYDNLEAALASGNPTRSWVFKTSETGRCGYDETYFVSGDALYKSADGIATLPLGTVIIVEKVAPVGYQLSSFKYLGQIYQPANGASAAFRWLNVPAQLPDGVVTDAIIRGGVTIAKWDFESDSRNPQGNGLLNATVEIVSNNDNAVLVEGEWYGNGQIVKTVTLSDAGLWTSANDLLPYGTYIIREKTAPTGYTSAGITTREFSITSNGVIVNMDSADKALKNKIIRGGIQVSKWDAQLHGAAQGDATLYGATFDIYNASDHDVLVQGVWYAPGKKIDCLSGQIRTDHDGTWVSAALDLLPYGTYDIRETGAPYGYVFDEESKVAAVVTQDNAVARGDNDDSAFKNEVIRGGVTVTKYDSETGMDTPQGDALLDATFAIVNRSEKPVVVDGVAYGYGQVVATIKADGQTGVASTAANLLPFGTYEVFEQDPATGYLLDKDAPVFVFRVREADAGKLVSKSVQGSDMRFGNQVIRIGVAIDKTMVGGPVSNAQGIGFAVCDSRGNRMSWIDENGNVVDMVVLGKDGRGATPSRALPYGRYTVHEIGHTVPSNVFPYAVSSGTGCDLVGELFGTEDGKTYHVAVENTMKPQIVAHKVDSETGQGVVNTVFTLEKLVDGEWVQVGKAETDDNGDCIFDCLDFGTYRLTEIYPNPNYMSPEEGNTIGQFILEVNAASGQSQIQVVEDKPIHVETAEDKVETIVDSPKPHSGKATVIAKTADSNGMAVAGLVSVVIAAAATLVISRRRKEE